MTRQQQQRRRPPGLHAATLVLLLSITSTITTATSAWIIPDPIVHFSVGAVAGGAGAFAAYPLDYLKSQMQTEHGKETYQNGWDCFLDTVRKNPLLLYKGVGVQLMGIAPEKGIKLGVNDMLATTFMTSSLGSFPLWGQVLSGGVAGACQVVASSPLEVLKVGLQTSDKSLAQVWQQVGGVKGLFRGGQACMARDIVWTAICFPLYAYLTQELGLPRE
jgi:solute carrier family 25 aspartate/glutamate transporter 12/13